MNRRDFFKRAAATGATLSAAQTVFAQGRVIGANDKINVGVIGVGLRGTEVAKQFAKHGEQNGSCKIVAVCDVYEKRKNKAAKDHNCEGYLDYREVLDRKDVDAVIVATPDHWHAPIAIAAMEKGKDVYCEKPMCHTIDQAKEMSAAVKKHKRVLQVGSQTTSADQWHKAKQYIADGAIGKMIMSQGSYHRNSNNGEWNWPIDANAGPDKKGEDYIDWKMWLGNAPKRNFDADRYFRFRKYWDYSGGIATDLFFHVVAPMNICWSRPQFPTRVSAMGGTYIFKDEREVPDTFNLIADYPEGHSLVLSSSMANSRHIPGLIRGHMGTIIMVDHGMFEGRTDHITLIPERGGNSPDRRIITDEYISKFGKDEKQIPVEQYDMMQKHVGNFLSCVRSREKPTLDVDTAMHAQATITMAVMSYRNNGQAVYWDDKAMNATLKAPKA